MALSTTEQRFEMFQRIQREGLRDLGKPTALLKNEFLELAGYADDWLDADANRYNNTIPTALRAKATKREKALALREAINKRFQLEED